jgi:ribosomal protein S18 acetylase RimI-like enzyme
MKVRVRIMEEGDIPFALQLTATEDWGYSEADFQRLMKLEPRGCFIAEGGGKRLGVTFLTAYGPVAWLGSVIVAPRARGMGVGTALMDEALGYADSIGVESVRLNAYLHAVPFYEKLGFRPEFENVRYTGLIQGDPPALPTAQETELAGLAEFDAPYFGANRLKVLRALWQDFPEGFFVLRRHGELAGYVVAGGFSGGVEVAPLVATDQEAAHLLLSRAANLGLQSFLSIPTANKEAVALVKGLHLKELFRSLRMYRGSWDHGGRLEGYYALAGLEKG